MILYKTVYMQTSSLLTRNCGTIKSDIHHTWNKHLKTTSLSIKVELYTILGMTRLVWSRSVSDV